MKQDYKATIEDARRAYAADGSDLPFERWLRQWWPDFLEPDEELRKVLGPQHPNVVLGDARRATRREKSR